MAARTSMGTIIAMVRDMIGDPVGANQVFTDERIQSLLDARRRHVVNYPMVGAPIRTLNSLTYQTFSNNIDGVWEDGALVNDSQYTNIVYDSMDTVTGQVVLTAPRAIDDLYLTGYAYDENGTAADLLEEWFAKRKEDFSFSRGGRSFSRGEQRQNFQDLIQMYRARSWVLTSTMVRLDMR